MSSPPPEASLVGIPAELREKIFKYVLPTHDIHCWILRQSFGVCHDFQSAHMFFGELYTKPQPNHYKRWHLDLLVVNKACYAEALYLIHHRKVSMGIGYKAFTCEAKRLLGAVQSAARDGQSWTWGPMLPGINFSLIKKLEIVVEPVNAAGYWCAMESLLRNFCETRLETGQSLKELDIKLMDMLRNALDPYMFPGRWVMSDQANLHISARFEDYETALRTFKKVAQKVGICNIHLPYWMETHPKIGWLKREWEIHIGAQLHFMRLPTFAKIGEDVVEVNNDEVPRWVWVTLNEAYGWWDGNYLPWRLQNQKSFCRKELPFMADLAS